MTEAPAAPQRSLLPPQLKFSLWRRIDRRLQRGEVLITTDQFQKVMEREFRKLLRVPAPRKVKELLRGMIVKVNNSHPEAYLTLGIKNAVTTYLRDVQARIEGESASDRDDVLGMIKQMVDGGRTAFFLESIGVEIGERGVSPRIEDAIKRIVDGQRLRPTEQATTQRIRRRGSGAEWVPVRTREDEKAAPPPEDGPAQAEAPSEQEQKDRIRAEREAEQQIAEKEMLKAPQHLDSWVKQDLVSEEEAVSLRELYSVNERLKKGEIDPEEAERIRSGMDAAVRENIEKRLRQAVDYAVLYLNVFTALKRIPEERDEVLKFAIRHKSLVMATDEGIDLGPMTVELEQDEELLDGLVRLIDRRDQEVRMIAARLSGETVEIGYGRSLEQFRVIFYRPVLVVAGQPVTIDGLTPMELASVGTRPPAAFADSLAACATRHWLIPKGEQPFSLKDFRGRGRVFDDRTREVFQATYRKTASYEFLDVWSCSAKISRGPRRMPLRGRGAPHPA